MNRYIITTGTVTYAIKGRNLLQRKGFKARIEKTVSGKGSAGCGYGISVEGDIKAAEAALRHAGVKILEINIG